MPWTAVGARRDRALRVDQRLEHLAIDDAAIDHPQGGKLHDLVSLGIEPGGLGIEDDIGQIIERALRDPGAAGAVEQGEIIDGRAAQRRGRGHGTPRPAQGDAQARPVIHGRERAAMAGEHHGGGEFRRLRIDSAQRTTPRASLSRSGAPCQPSTSAAPGPSSSIVVSHETPARAVSSARTAQDMGQAWRGSRNHRRAGTDPAP